MLWSDEVNKARITRRRRKEQDEEARGSCAAAAAAAKLCLLHRAQQSSPVQCSAVHWCMRAAIVHRSKTTKKHPVPSISNGPEKEKKEKKLDTYLLTYLPTYLHLPTNQPF
jgi:hypothetical protein